MSPPTVLEATSPAEFDAASSGPAIAFFWAEWHEPSRSGGQMDQIFSQLAERYGSEITFIKVEAESVPELSERFGISVVPSFVLSPGKGVPTTTVEGANPPELVSKVEAFVAAHSQGRKGTLMVDAAAASQAAVVPAVGPEGNPATALDAALRTRLSRLINAAPVMLFMKGSPAEPRCKFSRRTVELLQAAGVGFGSFDILSDDAVRQGLKAFSDWPTYPQLYSKGALVGGVDIIAEMAAQSGGLREALGLGAASGPEVSAGQEAAATSAATAAETVEERCRKLIGSAAVMLFMKGSPQQPKCGFSRQICAILGEQGAAFETFDILEDSEVREGLKKYSDWPTYPQLYVKGELVGGLDIVRELAASGELAAMLA